MGEAIIELGGGRKVLTDKVDYSVGLEMLVRIGDIVESGQPLVHLFSPVGKLSPARELVQNAIVIGEDEIPSPELIVERIEG